MTIKNSGLAAGGRAHPEIRPGDKWKDGRGGIVIIESYRFNRVTYYREGYDSPCFCTPGRLEREFTFVSAAPFSETKDIDRIMQVQGAERIRVMREIIRERGSK
ncbi:DUF4222 domain-containing protein [Salmonella enterica subsp. enterica serovar Berkeley]|uniref:DUF4222 domain-containing protein n=1 Tax=Salmonella enterica subsp. salamae serovar 48:d:z6 TaxID=1151170 RepID=A0A729JQD2_SALER|nr:DUF4222 domain-containing protein [Salmonella enterica]EDR6295135.1 DUF4222 domain-containing protein [Salmonella enterica subsp. enterica serovar Berkeley]HAC6541796.1 DUF4222 domain-containing protein [Salmonella enterica subsp. salamae serovar 48:d:z6]EBQ1374805.1 DUF4222 domain-containing protein [Salmonella enterica]EHA2588886.1 DUF4222 domain-containing protein [Salmonella enterica]